MIASTQDVIREVLASDDIEEIRAFALTSVARESNLTHSLIQVGKEMMKGADERTEAIVDDVMRRSFDVANGKNVVLAMKIIAQSMLGLEFKDMSIWREALDNTPED